MQSEGANTMADKTPTTTERQELIERKASALVAALKTSLRFWPKEIKHQLSGLEEALRHE